jgi:hypothetical protein
VAFLAAPAAEGVAVRVGAGRAAARAGAGRAAGRKAATSKAEQIAAIQQIKDSRKPTEPEPEDVERRRGNAKAWKQMQAEAAGETGETEQAEGPSSSSGGRRLPSINVNTKHAGTGGGFVLGLIGYAFGLAYLRGGKAEVKRLLRAKLFNEVAGA